MAKQKFKLVYVKDGSLCGSYSGIPGKDDVVLITRAALEGLESPIPEGYVIPEGVLEITENGEVDIAEFKKVIINVAGQVPTGSIEITTNGEHDVAGKAIANVNVPIPEGYVLPQGSIDITTNGNNIDVTNKASVNVNVPSYPEPTGTLEITANGTYDVKDKASANVNVAGVQPTGTLEIYENGVYDVVDKANVDVDVPYLLAPYDPVDGTRGWIRSFYQNGGYVYDINSLNLYTPEFTYDAEHKRVLIYTCYNPDEIDQVTANYSLIRVECNNTDNISEWEFNLEFATDIGGSSFRFIAVLNVIRNVRYARLTEDSRFMIEFRDLPENVSYSKSEYLQMITNALGISFSSSSVNQIVLCDLIGQKIQWPNGNLEDYFDIVEIHHHGSGSGSGDGSDSEE